MFPAPLCFSSSSSSTFRFRFEEDDDDEEEVVTWPGRSGHGGDVSSLVVAASSFFVVVDEEVFDADLEEDDEEGDDGAGDGFDEVRVGLPFPWKNDLQGDEKKKIDIFHVKGNRTTQTYESVRCIFRLS